MSEITSHEVSKALRAAKARIQKYGWVQSTAGNESIGFCIGGAFGHFGQSFRPPNEVAYWLLADVVGEISAAGWNDAPERTKEDVLAAFDSAIALVDGETE